MAWSETPEQKAAREKREEEEKKKKHNDEINNKITKINGKISDASEVKRNLNYYKSSLEIKLGSLTGKKNKISETYTDIKSSDNFEGEIANKLVQYMETTVTDLKNAITNIQNLINKINSQVANIDSYISNLQSERTNLYNDLW